MREEHVEVATSGCPAAVVTGSMPGRYDSAAVEEELYRAVPRDDSLFQSCKGKRR